MRLAPASDSRKQDQLCRASCSLVSHMPLAHYVPLDQKSSPQAPINTNQWSRVTRDTPTDAQVRAASDIRAKTSAKEILKKTPRCLNVTLREGNFLDATDKKNGEIEVRRARKTSSRATYADLPHNRRPLHRPHTRRDARLPVGAPMITAAVLRRPTATRRHGDACLARAGAAARLRCRPVGASTPTVAPSRLAGDGRLENRRGWARGGRGEAPRAALRVVGAGSAARSASGESKVGGVEVAAPDAGARAAEVARKARRRRRRACVLRLLSAA